MSRRFPGSSVAAVVGGAVLVAGVAAPGCESPGPKPRGTNPDLEGDANRLRSVMAAGSLEAAFRGITTVGFAPGAVVPDSEPAPSAGGADAPPPTEREQLGAAIAEQIKGFFTQAGYEWLDEGRPQRTIEFGWFLSESDGLAELNELSRIAPGIPDVGSLERGMLVVAVSWPGRAAPVCRVSIDGVGRLAWPVETKLRSIPGSVERLLTGVPRGPIEPALERVPEPGAGTESGPPAATAGL